MSAHHQPDAGTAEYAAAVALLTRRQLGVDVPRDALLGDVQADSALKAMEVITGGVLDGVWPRDHGAGLLEQLGLYFATAAGAAT